jgi:hypothetical protein
MPDATSYTKCKPDWLDTIALESYLEWKNLGR